MFSSCNPKFFAVRHLHYPVNPSSDHFHTEAVVPSSDHCHTEALLPPSDRYCIESVAPSGDHYCIDIVVPSSDHRPLSRRLDRCDRVIHNESGDPNGGNMCSFSGATYTSRVRHNADYVPYAKIRFDLRQRVASLTLNCDFAIRAYCCTETVPPSMNQ